MISKNLFIENCHKLYDFDKTMNQFYSFIEMTDKIIDDYGMMLMMLIGLDAFSNKEEWDDIAYEDFWGEMFKENFSETAFSDFYDKYKKEIKE